MMHELIPGRSQRIARPGVRISLGMSSVALVLVLVAGPPQVTNAEDDARHVDSVALLPSTLMVTLDHAEVRIVIEPRESHTIRWWTKQPGDDGLSTLSVRNLAGTTSIERPAAPDAERLAEMVIELSMDLGHPIFLGGSDLDLTVSQSIEEEEEEEEAHGESGDNTSPPARTDIEVDLASSVAFFEKTGAVSGESRSCSITLSETAGAHNLVLSGGDIRLASHHGQATITGEDISIIAKGMSGDLTTKTTGGSLDLDSFHGRFKIEIQDGQAQIYDSGGSGSFITSDSLIDIRQSQLSAISFRSEESYLSATNNTGAVSINATGGRLTLDSSKGSVRGHVGAGAVIEISDHLGSVTIQLDGDAAGSFEDIRGFLSLNSIDAHATVFGAETLAYTGNNSSASLAKFPKLTVFQATSSDVELDLTDLDTHKLNLAVQAGSRLSIDLRSPCRVQANGVAKHLANQVDVRGCELKLGERGRWSSGNLRGLDGRPPMVLVAQVADSAELTVVSRP